MLVPAVYIQELGPPFRSITLQGRDMPEQPVQVDGRQRATQSWYPGTNQASTQVMGTQQEPIVFRGWFWDELSVLDGGPKARVAILRDLMDGQQLCQLLWGDNIVRQGRVERCSFGYHRPQKIRYEFTFAVDKAMEPGSLNPRVGVAAAVADLGAAVQTIVAAADTMLTAVGGVKAVVGVVT